MSVKELINSDPTRKSLNLSNKNVSDSDFPFLYNYLNNNQFLVELDLSNNNIKNGIKYWKSFGKQQYT